jgi:hypothetical protein
MSYLPMMWLSLVFSVVLPGNAAANHSSIPSFEQYRVTRIYRGKPAAPVLRTPEDREYRIRIRKGASEGPNFAGHYTIIILGCGTQCSSFVTVDAATGRVFSHAQKEYTCWPTFKLDSRLLGHRRLRTSELQSSVLGMDRY